MSRQYKLVCSSLVAVAVVICAVSGAQAQGRPGGGGGWRGGSGGVSDLMLLQNEQLRTELGIVDEQVEKLDALQKKQREQIQEFFSGFRDLSQEAREAKMAEGQKQLAARGEEMKKEMESILLPNQVKRLAQITRQTQMQMSGRGSTSSDFIAKELKLDDAQKEKLLEKAKEVDKKLTEKMTKVRKEAEDELLSILTPEQRAQWKEMIGEQFQMQWGGRGGAGGAGGAQGTRRPAPADGF